MLAGGLLFLVAAVRLPSALDDDEQPVAAGGLCVGVPCRANDDPRPTRGYEAPSLAVDQADPKHQVVTAANLVGGRCGWHTTFDGGLSWEDGVFEIPPEFDPSCTLDSAGLLPIGNVGIGANGTSVYAVMSSERLAELPPDAEGRPRSPGEGVLLFTSADGGRTFRPGREIVPGGGPEQAYVRPALTVAPGPSGADRLLLSVWGCAPGRCTQGFFTQSTDGGATFAPLVLVTPPPGGNSPSQPAIAADGTIYMTYIRRFDGGGSELLVTRSGDDGQTWDASIIETQDQIGLRYDTAKIAVDPQRGSLYMVFVDNRDRRPQVFFRRSRDQGRTWERVVRLHKGLGGRSYSPAMAVAPDGRIDVVFYHQLRRDIDDVHATFSTDGGTTFSADEKLNDQPIDRKLGYRNEIGDYWLPAVASTASEAFFAWTDTREGTPVTNSQDIFTRRVARGAPAP